MTHPVQHAVSGEASTLPTKAAGWIAVAFGAVHVVIAPLTTRDVLSQVAAEGWWDSFTLADSTTFEQAKLAETFWVTLGSFGVPVLALGCHIVWSARRGQRVPAWLGWILLAWSVPFLTALPRSPGWTIAVIGALVVAGDRRRNRSSRERAELRTAVAPRTGG